LLLIGFILVFYTVTNQLPENNQLALPPHPLPVASHISSLPRQARMFLVGCCVFFCCLAAAGVFVVIVRDVAILVILFVVIFVALVVAITLPSCPCTVVRPIPSPLHQACVFLVGCCMKKIKRLVGDVAILAILVVLIFVALVVAIALPKWSRKVVRPMLSHSVTPACFWLVVACKILNGGHLRPLSDFISVIFFDVQFTAPKKEKHPPHTLHPGSACSPSSLLSLLPTIG
jgi:hypothetical protein